MAKKYEQQDASVVIRGIEELEAKLARIAKEAPKQAATALYAKAQLIMTDSKENYVPVAPEGDSAGTLRSSGEVDPPAIIPGEDVFVRLSYGGDASAYATAIHEHLSPASPPSWQNVGKLNFHLPHAIHKYLETPVNMAIPGMLRDIAKGIHLDDFGL